MSQSLEDITKKYMTQPPASPTATSAPTAVKPSRALLDDALNRVEQSFNHGSINRCDKPQGRKGWAGFINVSIRARQGTSVRTSYRKRRATGSSRNSKRRG